MIKKKLFALATSTVLAASVLAGCGNSSADSTASTSASTAASVAASTAAPAASTAASTAASSASADASAEETLPGTLSDIKDMSVVVADDMGTAHMFTFEGNKPTGLDQVKDGDKVTVTYTGKLSEVDAFTGTIKSVEKAQ